mgnify:CR=1 FL=1|nr:MAG TPA: hypothetical protein [Caudoviricetes sp.]
MKIIEAIQEAYGPEYTTLEDAIRWWSAPRAWREDFTAVLTLKSGKRLHDLCSPYIRREYESIPTVPRQNTLTACAAPLMPARPVL